MKNLGEDEKKAYLDLHEFTTSTTTSILKDVLEQYKKYVDQAQPGDGIRVTLGSFLLDSVLDEILARYYNSIARKFELIAKTATTRVNDLFDSNVDYTQNVSVAVNAYMTQLRTYLKENNKQISNLRAYISGQADKLQTANSAIPTTLTSYGLAALGGAQVNPETNEPGRSDDGSYYAAGALTFGFLYTSTEAINLFSEAYKEKYGVSPNIRYRWYHFTPPDRELIEHARLAGKTFTAETAPFVLRNNTVPWLGDTFYPNDHYGCACAILPELF